MTGDHVIEPGGDLRPRRGNEEKKFITSIVQTVRNDWQDILMAYQSYPERQYSCTALIGL